MTTNLTTKQLRDFFYEIPKRKQRVKYRDTVIEQSGIRECTWYGLLSDGIKEPYRNVRKVYVPVIISTAQTMFPELSQKHFDGAHL